MNKTFRRALALLLNNPAIVLPPLCIGAFSSVVAYLLARTGALSWSFFANLDQTGAAGFAAFLATVVAIVWRLAGIVLAMAFTTGMAGAAWLRGKASFADGGAAFRRHGVQAALAAVVLFAMGFVAAVLAIPTFFISLIVYLVFFIYTMPAVFVGGLPATRAVVASIALAWRNLRATTAIIALVLFLAFVGAAIGAAVGRVPLAGHLVAWLVMEGVVAYATLVVVGEYLNLQRIVQ